MPILVNDVADVHTIAEEIVELGAIERRTAMWPAGH